MLFDAMPMPVFVVDNDVRILECNAAAARWFGPDKQSVLKLRAGKYCIACMQRKRGRGVATRPPVPIARCAKPSRLLPRAGL